MLSTPMNKVLITVVAVTLVIVVAGVTPPRASAGISTSPGAGHNRGLTAGISDGTSNTVVTSGGFLLSRKAGGGQQEYIVILPPPHAPPFMPVPYPVSSAR